MPGLLRGIARTAVVAGTATGVSNRVSRRQRGRWAKQEEPAAPAAPAGTSRNDTLSQLKELGELKRQGVLTEDEFQTEKRKILGS